MSWAPRPVSDEDRLRCTEIRLTNAAIFVGTVLFWAFVGATLARAFQIW